MVTKLCRFRGGRHESFATSFQKVCELAGSECFIFLRKRNRKCRILPKNLLILGGPVPTLSQNGAIPIEGLSGAMSLFQIQLPKDPAEPKGDCRVDREEPWEGEAGEGFALDPQEIQDVVEIRQH